MVPIRDSGGGYGSYPYGLSSGIENGALDLVFQLRQVARPSLASRGAAEPITIIEIDEESIRASNVRLQRWPRDWYARIVERASQGGAAVIGLDLLLSERGGSCAEDLAADVKLGEAIADAGNVVLAKKLAAGGFPAINPLETFESSAWTVGFVDIPPDPDGAVRSTQLFRHVPGEDTQFSFAARLAEGYLLAPEGEAPHFLSLEAGDRVRLGDRSLPLRTDLNLQLDYRSRTPAFTRVSANDILFKSDAPLSDDLFRDRVVLIGASNIDAPDLFRGPFYEWFALPRLLSGELSSDPVQTPGVELHATSVATLLFGRELWRPSYVWRILTLLPALALAAFGVFRLRVLWGLLFVVAVAAGALALSSWAFNEHGLILPLANGLTGLALLTPVGLGLRFARERVLRADTEAERAQVMDILSRCVSQDVAQELWQRRESIMTGERRTVTLIFTDVRSFTTISETAPSSELVVWLNDYFSRMNSIIESHCGHIDKFIGDGLMVVFGAPASRGDDAEARAAVACGLDMLEAVNRMNAEWEGTGRPVFQIGVGIHTGEATCGVVGSERRLEYTVIGDPVNLAARLESTTKEYDVPMLVSEATVQLLGEDFESRPLGEVTVKGKRASTKIYAVKRNGAPHQALPAAEHV